MNTSNLKDVQKITKTGYPSIDKPWEKYYPKGAINFEFPKMKAYDLIYERNKDRKDCIELEYEGRKSYIHVNNLPEYMVPKEIEFRTDLPRTERGKIDFRALEN